MHDSLSSPNIDSFSFSVQNQKFKNTVLLVLQSFEVSFIIIIIILACIEHILPDIVGLNEFK